MRNRSLASPELNFLSSKYLPLSDASACESQQESQVKNASISIPNSTVAHIKYKNDHASRQRETIPCLHPIINTAKHTA